MKKKITEKEELEQVWDMLHRAMTLVNDLTGHYHPSWRVQQEIDDLIEGITDIEGRQE